MPSRKPFKPKKKYGAPKIKKPQLKKRYVEREFNSLDDYKLEYELPKNDSSLLNA